MSHYDINILVNGHRCKIYQHKNRSYIEAKEGSEYVIEVKNNSWEKILAVLSVDGLNIVDGEPASEQGAGYVLDKYSSQKFYGFQYSKEKVATFKFGALGAVGLNPATGEEIKLGYAASKEKGYERNAGVIGIRLWNEIVKPPPPTNYILSSSWACGSCHPITGSCSYSLTSSYALNANYLHNNPSQWGTNIGTGTTSPGTPLNVFMNDNSTYYSSLCGGIGETRAVSCSLQGTINYSTDRVRFNHVKKGGPISPGMDVFEQDNSTDIGQGVNMFEDDLRYNLKNMTKDFFIPIRENEPEIACFDTETQWANPREFKIKEVEFERKEIIHSVDIYYASRDALITMGVDLSNEKKVSFPTSFVKFATPPKGWKP